MLTGIGALVVAYVLGAVPFGYIIVKQFVGADVRAIGSGSTGATNVARSAGVKAGAVTYLLDVAKGALAVFLMRLVHDDPMWLGAAAAAVVVGHIYPVFLGFRGGKGVATGVGAYLMIVPVAVLTTLVVWIAIFWRTRIVSLASIVATALVPLWAGLWILIAQGVPLSAPSSVKTMAGVGIGCVLIIAKHHENIGRLFRGTEHRFVRSASETPDDAEPDRP